MGSLYEKILHKFSVSKTSFYTPTNLIREVLAYCEPTIRDSILDPTCGSGAFLSQAIAYATEHCTDDEELLNFYNNVVGVDRDSIACKIAKVSLLCTFMRRVGPEYHHSGRPLPKPKIQTPVDFFDWHGPKFDVVLGNPPWESIDRLPAEKKLQLSSGNFHSYQDKNDQLCYVVEKCLRRHIAKNGRFGFVIKLQALTGTQYHNFHEILDQRVERIIDYGNEKLFSNGAQTAIICGRNDVSSWTYLKKNPGKIARFIGETVPFSDLYEIDKGAESAANGVYKKFAFELPQSTCIRLNPIALGSLDKGASFRPMAYVWGDAIPSDFKRWILQNPKEAEKLEKRADVVRSGRFKFSWRSAIPFETNGSMLITELFASSTDGNFRFVVDLERKYLPITKQVCIVSRTKNIEDIILLGALMCSTYFKSLCKGYKLSPLANDGVLFNPSTVSQKVRIPVLSPDVKKELLKIGRRVALAQRSPNIVEMKLVDSILKPYLEFSVELLEERGEHEKLLLSQHLGGARRIVRKKAPIKRERHI